MSSLSINNINSYFQSNAQNSYQQNQQNFLALGNALQSGNLTAAQSAFSALQQQYQTQSSSNGSSSSQQSSTNNSVGTDLQNLNSALQSGNLTSAQQAFLQLQHDLQTQRGQGHHGHHHHGGGGSSSTQQAASTTSSASGSAQTGTIDVAA